ncbi:hypothetical protein SAMN04488693_1464 [Arthrobacter subterraneus]|uniref:DUF6545 domain-containing protein n=1 Tax=Arthrobacter subterraneus TaxID=335973 RepID=A0A1G8QAB3_9MICC|nr:DUF6545 domain-containing protein [Arthrobacter subterraneus]SDJ01548.1 hypothetical protein SAMN04488693_1464 [Arthrobacter subterraneus]
MIQALVAVLMWVLVVSLLILRRRRTERSITYAALTISVAMTLNVDAIYSTVDTALGATNMATLVADGALMIGLFFLGRGIMKAGGYRPRLVRVALGLPALLLSLVGVGFAFLLIDRGATTTTFMSDLGAQPAAATYSMIGFTYCGIVVAAMLILAGRQYRLGDGAQRIPAGLLLLGSAFGVALCLVVLIMDVAHVVGNLDLMDAVAAAYGPLYLLTFVFLCTGLAGQSAVRYMRDRSRGVRTGALVNELEPIWRRATLVRPGLSQTHSSATNMEEPETRLHREIVEIRDAMIDPRVSFEVTGHERALLGRAEDHLLGLDGRGAQAADSSSTRRGSERGHV